MISAISLSQFKCFENLNLPIKPLTLLSGTNASGKSSVLQSLVLLHQTMHDHEWAMRLMLNGKELKLGTVSDVVNKISGRRSIEIGITGESESYRWYLVGERSDMSMAINKISANGKQVSNPHKLHFLAPEKIDSPSTLLENIRRLTYITAERVGPRDFYDLEDEHKINTVGKSGEHAVGLLYNGRDNEVHSELLIEGVPPTRLRQVEAYMQMFFPGCGLTVQKVSQVNAVTLGLRTSDETDYHRPIHVGFGFTQVFPIIVAALSATKGEVILIENPEVHLHPAGQALMGQFLASVSNAGVQVILETHSDHVLNGIRRSVRSKNITPDKVAIHFFRPRTEEVSQVHSPQLDEAGNLDTWPEGFFDQFDKDMDYFAGWGE